MCLTVEEALLVEVGFRDRAELLTAIGRREETRVLSVPCGRTAELTLVLLGGTTLDSGVISVAVSELSVTDAVVSGGALGADAVEFTVVLDKGFVSPSSSFFSTLPEISLRGTSL